MVSLSRAAADDDDTNTASECCEDRSCKRLVECQRQAAKEGGEENQQYQLGFNTIHCQFFAQSQATIARPLRVTRELVRRQACGRALMGLDARRVPRRIRSAGVEGECARSCVGSVLTFVGLLITDPKLNATVDAR